VSEPEAVGFWEERYRTGRTRWERPGLHPAFLAWRQAGTLSPCRILVPGAGRSPEPAALAEAGFDITVLDLASSAVEAQRARLAGTTARVIEADLLGWHPAVAFDAIYDQTCLCALPPARLPDYAARLAAWLRPEGQLFLLLMQTGAPGGPPFDCPLPAMRALFPAPNWEWPSALAPAVAHPSGLVEQPVVLRRRGADAPFA